jgi:hypothetical protein
MNRLFDRHFALSIGPQRCGTAWLEQYLRGRGDVCLPHGVKELFFFDRLQDRGPEFYASHFHPEPRHSLVMELTTTAFDAVDAPRQVRKLLGAETDLLCPLRDPVERAYAVYQDYVRYGIVSGGIAEAVEQAPQILFSSRYAEHLERWIEGFGVGRIKIVFYEDLLADPETYAHKVSAALSLPKRTPVYQTQPALPPVDRPLQEKRDLLAFLQGFKLRAGRHMPLNQVQAETDRLWLRERLGPETERLRALFKDVSPPWPAVA